MVIGFMNVFYSNRGNAFSTSDRPGLAACDGT
jgi:hypothetical protein